MTDAWDSSLYDPTKAPSDGFRIYSAGGRSGPLALENGAALSFPWATQQQIADTTAARIYVDEHNFPPRHEHELQLIGAKITTGLNPPSVVMSSPYPDDTTSLVQIIVSSGGRSSEVSSTISVAGGAVGLNQVTYNSSRHFFNGGYIDTEDIHRITGGIIKLGVAGQAHQIKIIDTGAAATLPPALGTLATHLFKVGSDSFTASHYHLGFGGRYIQAYKDATNIAGDLYLNPSGGGVYIGDQPVAGAAWTSYTPSLTQSVTVTKTVTYARYLKIGRMVTVEVYLLPTSSGTANQIIQIGLPFNAVQASIPGGNWYWYDASANVNFCGTAIVTAATTMGGLVHGTGALVGQTNGATPVVPNQVASGDALLWTMTYEATT